MATLDTQQRYAVFVVGIICVCCFSFAAESSPVNWSKKELALIDSLRLANLGDSPIDPTNRFSGLATVERLGARLFHDTRLSANGRVSCATCHRPDYGFTDALPRAQGLDVTDRRSMPIAGSAFSQWLFWDGRSDSLWAQALVPLEDHREHGLTRRDVAELVLAHYGDEYEQVARSGDRGGDKTTHLNDEQVTEVFVNTGKFIAAFVRTIELQPTTFDLFADALILGGASGVERFDSDSKAGLRLFLGKGQCINCHNGPLFSNGEFHHAGVVDRGDVDQGRSAVVGSLLASEFSCASSWSDADETYPCKHFKYLEMDDRNNDQAFKTPSLRGVSGRAPYMHAGQFETLAQVLKHYGAVPRDGLTDELRHQGLSAVERQQLEIFLGTLIPAESVNYP